MSLALTGCQTAPSKDDDTTGSSDASRTRVEGTAIGALLGGLLGYAVGGDNRGQGALIGAAVGAGAGYLLGNEIAKRKQQYASEEDFLDAEIASAKEYNATATAYNVKLREEIAQLERRSGLLQSRYRAGMAVKDEIEAERKSLKEQIASSQKVYEDLKKEYDVKVAVVEERKKTKGSHDVYVNQLEQEIASLKDNLDQLQAQSVQLAQINERLTI